MRRILVVVLVVSALAGIWSSGRALERLRAVRPAELELLYLPNGQLLRFVSLGHATVLADAIYLWAIQYYSNYEREDRYRYVQHVFDGVITELDPHFVDAYWLGALILILEADQLEAGLQLLDKGAARNPEQWILPYLAAWESYHAGQYDRAQAYFERASRVPGAPPIVRRLRAGMASKAGRLDEALRMWQSIHDDPASDRASVAIAERQLRQLRMRLDVRQLRRALEAFRIDNGRTPQRLEELVRDGYLRQVPRLPGDREFVYDPTTGQVATPEGRVLGDG